MRPHPSHATSSARTIAASDRRQTLPAVAAGFVSISAAKTWPGLSNANPGSGIKARPSTPDFAPLHPGYEEREKGKGTPKGAVP
jgi:hypothetical protein